MASPGSLSSLSSPCQHTCTHTHVHTPGVALHTQHIHDLRLTSQLRKLRPKEAKRLGASLCWLSAPHVFQGRVRNRCSRSTQRRPCSRPQGSERVCPSHTSGPAPQNPSSPRKAPGHHTGPLAGAGSPSRGAWPGTKSCVCTRGRNASAQALRGGVGQSVGGQSRGGGRAGKGKAGRE